MWCAITWEDFKFGTRMRSVVFIVLKNGGISSRASSDETSLLVKIIEVRQMNVAHKFKFYYSRCPLNY